MTLTVMGRETHGPDTYEMVHVPAAAFSERTTVTELDDCLRGHLADEERDILQRWGGKWGASGRAAPDRSAEMGRPGANRIPSQVPCKQPRT